MKNKKQKMKTQQKIRVWGKKTQAKHKAGADCVVVHCVSKLTSELPGRRIVNI